MNNSIIRTSFGYEIVDEIVNNEYVTVSLEGTTVKGDVRVVQVKATDAKIGGNIVVAGAEMDLKRTSCRGSIKNVSFMTASQCELNKISAVSVQLNNCTVTNKTKSQGFISAIDCEVLGDLVAHGSISIQNCRKMESAAALDEISIQNTEVLGDVLSINKISVISSKILGELNSCASIRVASSNVNLIRFTKDSIWKEAYQNAHNSSSKSCDIFFKGSKNLVVKSLTALFSRKHLSNTISDQILELDDNSVVKDVIFEKGSGKIFMKNGSKITGQVIGGEIIN